MMMTMMMRMNLMTVQRFLHCPATLSTAKKYNLLLERCNAIQQDNELFGSRVKEVKKLRKKSLRERRLLINRLDSHGDNFRNIPVTFPFSQDENLKKAKDKKVKKSGNSDEPGPSGRGRKPKSEKEKPARDPNLPKRPQKPARD